MILGGAACRQFVGRLYQTATTERRFTETPYNFGRAFSDLVTLIQAVDLPVAAVYDRRNRSTNGGHTLPLQFPDGFAADNCPDGAALQFPTIEGRVAGH